MLALDLEIVTDAFPSQRAQAVAQVVALLVGLVSAATAVVLVNGYGHLSKQYVRRLNVEMHRLRSEDD